MKIVVLVKQVPDTWGERRLDPFTGRVDRESVDRVIDEISERALEVALSLKDKNKGTEVVVMSMGPSSATDGLRKGLSMGANEAVHVLDDALVGADAGWTSAVLAAALKQTGFDLVLAGNESTDGRGGVIPAMVAQRLGLPCLGSLNIVEIEQNSVRGERGTENGTARVHASLPAVVSVTERTPEARFPNFKGIMTAKRKSLTVLSLAELGMEPTTVGGRSVVLSTVERPARTAGKKIVDEGNAGLELAEFLAARHLI
ncbi:electron transfer flavoprotein subunit beta/FixA family protein [Pseudarthrobacter raffinosi]|uniref:electron transfer flavoprotein subunit beta/FixA family protein n=1 Tax=Pseudarthrobacter raffinosi TaxID=2953651 RepID=UPI00208F28B3|nr:electron transfer flavoprotein subunit beta/FixA family protein [Pseudarthrobacter sp. MDT3-9]MCO4253333.1 electron transfer flavoprotein subunit beta/FixA family protein [Pseudarthrobacter sp. MDT3-9]